jgi:hypothetical protein
VANNISISAPSVNFWQVETDARPRGSASPILSGIFGIPVELENRTQTFVLGELKCGALESFLASSDGVNIPARILPFA